MSEAHCEWGPNGIASLSGRASVFVVVDVVSFSACVDIAVSRGAQIVPFAQNDHEAAARKAQETGALLAARRDAGGLYSLSPVTLQTIPSGTRLVLPSPNGSKLSAMAADTGAVVLSGGLRNASAVARAAREIGGDIAVIPAGERWTHDDTLRPAIEDLIGAGAILDALDVPLSPEARVARDAFRSARGDLADIIRGSMSGRELIGRGYAGDVELALQYDVSTAIPRLIDGVFGSQTTSPRPGATMDTYFSGKP